MTLMITTISRLSSTKDNPAACNPKRSSFACDHEATTPADQNPSLHVSHICHNNDVTNVIAFVITNFIIFKIVRCHICRHHHLCHPVIDANIAITITSFVKKLELKINIYLVMNAEMDWTK